MGLNEISKVILLIQNGLVHTESTLIIFTKIKILVKYEIMQIRMIRYMSEMA